MKHLLTLSFMVLIGLSAQAAVTNIVFIHMEDMG
jgi:hypothetical protein